MFKKAKQVLSGLFRKDKLEQQQAVQLVGKDSQPHVLATRVHMAGLKHEDQALVDLQNVRLVKGPLKRGDGAETITAFFCPMHEVVVKKKLKDGDGKNVDINSDVQLVGINAPTDYTREQSLYNLKDVLVCSNGVITLEGTPKTKWEKVKA